MCAAMVQRFHRCEGLTGESTAKNLNKRTGCIFQVQVGEATCSISFVAKTLRVLLGHRDSTATPSAIPRIGNLW